MPYMIGNGWGGGLVPIVTVAAYQSAIAGGSTVSAAVGYALIYPIAVPTVCLILSLFLMPETRKMSVWDESDG